MWVFRMWRTSSYRATRQGASASRETGRFVVEDDEVLLVEPQEPGFTAPVVVLVSTGTVSAGEGLAEAIQRLPHALVVGMFGSNGSYGMTGGRMEMPGGWRVTYPVGRAVDTAGTILLDADAFGHGGVVPDIRIPRSAENLLRVASGEDVELQWGLATLNMLSSLNAGSGASGGRR